MALFEVGVDSLVRVEMSSFANEKIREREDLQRLIRENLGVLDESLLLVAEEYSSWSDSNRRIDLLCLDSDANLVVVELKRDNDSHMELQAIRYAAMVSAMTLDQCASAYSRQFGVSASDAEVVIREHINSFDDDAVFPAGARIILASGSFSKELTTATLWLNAQGVDISCIAFELFKIGDGRLLLDARQVIPLPDVADFQTQIHARGKLSRENRSERHEIREAFWTELLDRAKSQTELHANRKPPGDGWIGTGGGRTGLSWTYSTRKHDSQVELYIDFGSLERNIQALEFLRQNKAEIEVEFGDQLEWQTLEDSRGCRVRYRIEGGYRSDRALWPELHQKMIEKMISLERSLRPWIERMPV